MITYVALGSAGVLTALACDALWGWRRTLDLTCYWRDRYTTLAAAVAADGDPASSAYFALVHLNAGLPVPDPDLLDIEGWRT